MADKPKTRSDATNDLPDNTSGAISPQDVRRGVLSAFQMPGFTTVTAGDGGSGSRSNRATAVQNAINRASNDSDLIGVVVPDEYLNYDASSVTFDNSVRMVREGQQADVIDAQAYGADPTFTNDSTAALQACINKAMTDHKIAYIPDGHYKYTRLWYVHDSTNNTDAPSADREQGRFIVQGAGVPAFDNLENGEYFGTVLESTEGTDPSFNAEKDVAGNPYRQVKFRDLCFVQSNSGDMAKINRANDQWGMENVVFYQEGTGNGIDWQNGFIVFLDRVNVFKTNANSDSGTGLTFNTEAGSGMQKFEQVSVKNFSTNWDLQQTLTGYLENCQANGGSVGMKITTGDWRLDTPHVEGYGTTGILIKSEADVSLDNPLFSGGNASNADIQVGDSGGANVTEKTGNALIQYPVCLNINQIGIKFEASGNSVGVTIVKPRLFDSGSGTGVGIDATNVDNFQNSVLIQPRFGSGLSTNISGADLQDLGLFVDNQDVRIAKSGGNLGFFGASPVAQQTAPASLTDNSGGTTDDTVEAVSGSGADSAINNNFAELIEELNQIRTALVNLGLWS